MSVCARAQERERERDEEGDNKCARLSKNPIFLSLRKKSNSKKVCPRGNEKKTNREKKKRDDGSRKVQKCERERAPLRRRRRTRSGGRKILLWLVNFFLPCFLKKWRNFPGKRLCEGTMRHRRAPRTRREREEEKRCNAFNPSIKVYMYVYIYMCVY